MAPVGEHTTGVFTQGTWRQRFKVHQDYGFEAFLLPAVLWHRVHPSLQIPAVPLGFTMDPYIPSSPSPAPHLHL